MGHSGRGAPGGIFLPLLVMGAIIGSIYYNVALLASPSLSGLVGNFIILGMAGYFSAIVRAPITGIILISEMTGSFLGTALGVILVALVNNVFIMFNGSPNWSSAISGLMLLAAVAFDALRRRRKPR